MPQQKKSSSKWSYTRSIIRITLAFATAATKRLFRNGLLWSISELSRKATCFLAVFSCSCSKATPFSGPNHRHPSHDFPLAATIDRSPHRLPARHPRLLHHAWQEENIILPKKKGSPPEPSPLQHTFIHFSHSGEPLHFCYLQHCVVKY